MRYARADQSCLVQEWVSTQSVGLEAFLWDGEIVAGFCLSDQYQDGFVSPIGHGLPAGLDEVTRLRVLAAARDFCRALGLSGGAFNFDLRVGPEDVCMIEVNARLGGNSITPLIRTAYGIDLAEAAVVAALGENPAPVLQATHEPIACATRLIAKRHGAEAVTACYEPLPGLAADAVTVELLASAGGQAVRVDDWVILGHCLVRSSTAEGAIELARKVSDSVLGRANAAVPA
jgi:biotin carboxylase